MPQKTRKEKQSAVSKRLRYHVPDAPIPSQKVEVSSSAPIATKPVQRISSNDIFHNKEEKAYFVADLKKSLVVIAFILCVEGGLYWAVQSNIIHLIK